MGPMAKMGSVLIDLSIMLWDNTLFLLNMLSPKLPAGSVVPKDCPGHNLTWPAYEPPGPDDSRSACPMLNAMANHSILPHSGKNISFPQLNQTVRQTFNFAPSFCFFVPKFAAGYLNKNYWKDSFDLADLSKHADDAIEHDASLTRRDAALEPDQGKPDQELVEALLREASGKTADGTALLTKKDLSRALSRRRAEARRTNKEYSESFFHNMFGSAK